MDNSQPHEKLRTKEWLLKISQLYDIKIDSEQIEEVK